MTFKKIRATNEFCRTRTWNIFNKILSKFPYIVMNFALLFNNLIIQWNIKYINVKIVSIYTQKLWKMFSFALREMSNTNFHWISRWWLARIKLITTNICAGAFKRVSLCRARLLGRRWWIPVDLSRSHFHYENTISLGSGSDRSKRFCQFPLSRNPFHREPLFAESASSHGSNISGIRLIIIY